MTLELLSVSVDNAWNIATALLLVAMYCVPVQCWDCLSRQKQSSKQRQQQPKHQLSSTPCPISKHLRKVTILSPLPHPSTDTTEVSEETESSELLDERYRVQEVVRNPRPVSTPRAKSVKIIGKPFRLAGIPESPCPALNSALKLKRKLMRHDAVGSRGSVSGESTGSSRRRRSNPGPVILPKTPLKNIRRCRSADTPVPGCVKRDAFLLDRLSEEQTAQ